ncbi:hypothetical protein OsI_21667 [Oryza sativa Indica Group]|uniref:glutathione synthase n=1 Tax=Oryza sativa subsp. indica TaxID=39946 RepID=B8B2Q1_ORYSI|nr:hypothetical protein OsI_21667 [Oryza sativa Indica Group]
MMEVNKEEDIRLGLHRSDYMLDSGTNSLLQIELNTISSSFPGLSSLVSELHRTLLNRHGKVLGLDSKRIPQNWAATQFAEALSMAWTEFNNKRDGQTVSVVYFRAGYSPNDYPSEAEWRARLLMEQSSAIKCPSISYHLVGTKKIQQELAKPNILERFLNNKEDIAKLRKCFAGLWSLDNEEIVKTAIEKPDLFVLKPQREGGESPAVHADEVTTPMAIGAGGDRLSALPDDLLLRVLHFANAVEAASTSLLSRRFGALWRSSGAVNLAARVPGAGGRDAFVRAADAALAAAGRVVTRLTLHVDDGDHSGYCTSMYNLLRDHDVVDAVVSHPAARRVEELRVAVAVHPFGHDKINTMISSGSVRIYDIKLASLPSKTLRVLDLTNCRNLTPASAAAAATAFPDMVFLRVFPNIEHLELDGAYDTWNKTAAAVASILHCCPVLRELKLNLVGTSKNSKRVQHFFRRNSQLGRSSTTRLRFPAATALTLINCLTNGGMSGSVIDAPRLRSLTYKGAARSQFELTSPAPDMKMVHLHFNHYFHQRDYLRFIHNFTKVKVLKLKAEHGCPWRILPQHCSPRARRSTVSPDYFKNSKQVQHFFQRKSQLDFDRSIDDFMRNSISKRGDHRHNGDEVSGFIPGLTACSFTCLQNNLRRVSLQFRLDENSENFGVRLVKFFAENAMVLEELRVLTVETET